MPVYCYQCEACGKKTEEYRPIEKRNESLKCGCGGKMGRAAHLELANSTDAEYQKEVLSDAMGVSPDQVAEHRQRFPDIPITNDGRVICTSHAQRKRVMKQLGFYDKDGYD